MSIDCSTGSMPASMGAFLLGPLKSKSQSDGSDAVGDLNGHVTQGFDRVNLNQNNDDQHTTRSIIETHSHRSDQQPIHQVFDLTSNHKINNSKSWNTHTAPQVAGFCGPFEAGFSDDEDRSRNEAFDRTFKPRFKLESNRLTKSPNKLPLRSNDEDELKESPRSKRQKTSIFGGPMQIDDHADDAYLVESSEQGESPLFGGNSDTSPKRTEVGDQLPTPPADTPKHFHSLDVTPQQPGSSRVSRSFSVALSHASSSDGGSPAPRSEDSFEISPRLRKEIEQNPYELRQGLNRNITGAWLDADKSGNFDPDEERKEAQLKRAKAQQRKKKRKGKQPAQPKERVSKCIVRLSFKSIGTVLNITDAEERWPDNWSDVDTEEECDDRKRAETQLLFRLNTPDVEPQAPIEDPEGLLDDLTGHPFARGCKYCRTHGEKCSMVSGGAWPCEQCSESDADCVLIVPPKTRGKCQGCTEDCADDEENYCSFEMVGLEPHAICHQCAAEDVECVPSITKGYRHPRIDLDEIMYGPGRKWSDCTNCRASRRKCSVKSKKMKGPCKQCRKSKIACTFYETPSKVQPPKKSAKKTDQIVLEVGESSKAGGARAANDGWGSPLHDEEDYADMFDTEYPSDAEAVKEIIERPMQDHLGRKGRETFFDTCFAHPMHFNIHRFEGTGCNFCELHEFGFIGYFEKNVYAMRWDDNLGFTELGGGHCDEYDETRMCSECTSQRVQIISCEEHKIRPIEEVNQLPEFHAAIKMLLTTVRGSNAMKAQLKLWCSMCFAPARFKCENSQQRVLGEEGEEEGNGKWINGCGLALCDRCEIRLREEFQGDCHEMAAALDNEPKIKSTDGDSKLNGAARADVGFLKPEGFFMRSVVARMQRESEGM